MEEIHWEEVDAILSFLAAASDSHLVRLSMLCSYVHTFKVH